MKNIKKIKFSDICGMLEKDEMKEILGGSGGVIYTCGAGDYSQGILSPSIPMSSSSNNGWGGGNIIGTTVGGIPYNSGIIAGGGSSSSTSPSTSSNYTVGWTQSNGAITTNDPNVIKRIVDYLDWERVVLKNEPTINQVNNFVNMDYLTGGKGILSDGSTLAQGMSITHDPYGEFKTIESLSRMFQNLGDSLTISGAALSTTGVGAIVGAPMMAIGGSIARIGTVAELYIDLNSKEPSTMRNGELKLV